jgi:hypothetical protein
MIYSYKYLPHPIENFHTNIAYFFQQLFANDLVVYDEDVLLQAAFIPIINDSGKLVNSLKEITRKYHLLTISDKQIITDALSSNCDMVNLCNNTGGITPVKYTQITDEPFRKLLKDFLTSLWEDYYFVNSIRDTFGTVQEHFIEFKKHQGAFVCPFCGLNPLKPSTSIYRNAYDHYIPKGIYPFISVNFKNLFPICHECNSDEKKTTDILYNGSLRRKVFFPFDTTYLENELTISIIPLQGYNPLNLKTLLDEIDWEIAINLAGINDPRLKSWDEIFHIKRRYKESLCDYQKIWFEDFVIKRYKQDLHDGLTFDRFRDKLLDDAKCQIKDNSLSILRFVYFNFLFSIPDFESKLKETLNVN